MPNEPNPPTDTAPPFTVPLPDLGAYPATGTDAAKDQWLRLAALHVSRAQVQASQAASAANDRLATAHHEILAEQKAWNVFMQAESVRGAQQATAYVAALDRLTESIGSIPSAGGGSGDGGLTAADVAIVGGLAQAIKASQSAT